MKPIAGRPSCSPRSQLLEEQNSRQDVPTEFADSKRTSAQADLQGELAEQSKQPRTSHHGMGANSARLLQRQLLDQFNAKPASKAPGGSKLKGAQTHSQALSLRNDAASNAVPDLAQPATGQAPMKPHWDQDDDFDWLPEIDELSMVDPTEQALLADGGTFTDATSLWTQHLLTDLDLDTEFETDEVLYSLVRPFTDEQEQALQAMMAEDLVDDADEVNAARPGPQPAPTDSQAVPLATGTTHAEALAKHLQDLGYSKKQATAIRPESRSEVVKHHPALSNLGFSFKDISNISKNVRSLQVLAEKYPQLHESLPALTQSEIVDIAMERSGHRALEVLLVVAEDLKAKPPHLNDQQLAGIAKTGKRPALLALHSLGSELCGHPYNLSSKQLVAIASNHGGKLALQAIKAQLLELVKAPYGLTPEQVVAIASNHGGKLALEAIKAQLPELVKAPYGLTPEQVVTIASKGGGKQALEAIREQLPELVKEPYGLIPEQVVAIASRGGGKQALEAIKEQLAKLLKAPYGLTPAQVVAIASNHGGKQALEAIKAQLPELVEAPYGLTPEQVVAIASKGGGKQALEAIKGQLLELVKAPYGLAPEQVVAIASHDGGKQALEAIKELLPKLLKAPYGLTLAQVVATASNIGGRPALEAIKEHLPELVEAPYGLTPNQVVAMASKGGGKQALEAIKAQLPELVKEPYGLTANQVVAIASHEGGRQALGAVMAYLPKLLDSPYKMSREQIVGFASRQGGKQELEKIIRSKEGQ